MHEERRLGFPDHYQCNGARHDYNSLRERRSMSLVACERGGGVYRRVGQDLIVQHGPVAVHLLGAPPRAALLRKPNGLHAHTHTGAKGRGEK